MSEPVVTEKNSFGLPVQWQERWNQFVKTRQESILGVPEIITLSISGLLLMLVLYAYFVSLVPTRKLLAETQLERNRLETQKREIERGFEEHSSVKTNVDKILESLQKFETNLQTNQSEGRIAVITELNEMIRSNELRSNGGASYAPLEPLVIETEEDKGKGSRTISRSSKNSKWLSVYPGIAIDLTVDGSYGRLRKFVREIEDSKWFVVINSIELEGSEMAAMAATQSSEGGSSSEVPVSLRLNLAAYFKRDLAGGTSTTDGQQKKDDDTGKDKSEDKEKEDGSKPPPMPPKPPDNPKPAGQQANNQKRADT
jgi:Tfp pilus assembly protein PilO